MVILLVVLGVFWFFFYEEGANRPICIEGTATVLVPGMMRSPTPLEIRMNATTTKFKFSTSIGKGEYDLILRLDKKVLIVVHHKGKSYAEAEFKYIEESKVASPRKIESDWDEIFDVTVDARYIGKEPYRCFCRKLRLKNAPGGKGGKVELWLTRDAQISRSYVGALNKMLRIEVVNAPMGAFGADKKRPQVDWGDMEYFPIPLKADIFFPVPGMGNFKLKWEVTKFSREGIDEKAFEPPAGYKKIPLDEMGTAIQRDMQRSAATPRR